MKILLTINALILLLLFIVGLIPDYYSNLVDFNVVDTLRQFEWTVFTGILIIGVLFSGIVGWIKYKNVPYPLRFLRINILINTVLLIFISSRAIPEYLDAKREYEVLSLKYKIKAESDMKNGLIIYEGAGLPMPLDSISQVKADKIDSLRAMYGIATSNIGCMISGPLLRAQSDYKELTQPFLDERNGKGWRQRMNREIAEIRGK